MAEADQDKSEHLKGLEAAFEKRTRRFSPFEILGLDSTSEDDSESDSAEEPTHGWVEQVHPPMGGYPPMGGTGTPTHGWNTPTRVVVRSKILRSEILKSPENTTTLVEQVHPPMGGTGTPMGGYQISTPEQKEIPLHTGHYVQDVAAAMVIRGQLSEKARQVIGCLNEMRSLEQHSYTIPLGYAKLSNAAGLSDRHLRREVLPRLAMLGLVAVAHRSMQGTIYLLQHDAAFLRLVSADDDQIGIELPVSTVVDQPGLSLFEPTAEMPLWIDQELWGVLPGETIQQLVAKAGSETQAQEKLAIIIYNESHGPEGRRVRDRRSVLSHYLRIPQADIWPNDEGYETLALRQARKARDYALAEKALAEEALRVQQDTARLRFLTGLAETQTTWLKREAKRRVDERPAARFLDSRYPLYKAEEEVLTLEWMDRTAYGETVPHMSDSA